MEATLAASASGVTAATLAMELRRAERCLRMSAMRAPAGWNPALVQRGADLLQHLVARVRHDALQPELLLIAGIALSLLRLVIHDLGIRKTATEASLITPVVASAELEEIRHRLTGRHGAREWILAIRPAFGSAGANAATLRAWLPQPLQPGVSAVLRRLLRTGIAQRHGERYVLTAAGLRERAARVIPSESSQPTCIDLAGSPDTEECPSTA